MAETDWMWCYENPKDAAAEIDRLRAANEHNERAIRSCNQKIGELELWAKDYRQQITFWKAKAEGSRAPGQSPP
jgi:hypothetical protein